MYISWPLLIAIATVAAPGQKNTTDVNYIASGPAKVCEQYDLPLGFCTDDRPHCHLHLTFKM